MVPLGAALLGLIWGSFANVVIYRVPKDLSVVKPSSSCANCARVLRWYENLPLVSYLFLGGRCRGCRTQISARYPIVEAATSLLWVATTVVIGLRPELPMFLAFVTALVVLSAIDLEARRLPNKVLWPCSLLALTLAAVAVAISTDGSRIPLAAAGALAYALPMLGIAVAAPGGMGGGDIKFAGYLGWHLGWLGLGRVAVGALLGFVMGGMFGVILLLSGRKGRKDAIPFGPFMAVGALISMLFGNLVLAVWLR